MSERSVTPTPGLPTPGLRGPQFQPGDKFLTVIHISGPLADLPFHCRGTVTGFITMPVNEADRYAFSRRRSSVRSFLTEFVYYVRFDEYFTFTEAPAVGGKPLDAKPVGRWVQWWDPRAEGQLRDCEMVPTSF